MASRVLYPPIVDSYMPAFVAGATSKCRVYFSLSKFNSRSDFSSVHISVVKQSSGLSVVKTTDNTILGRYRATGIILNAKPTKVEDKENLYYVDIENDDLDSKDNLGNKGWIPGWIYKIQIRLCAAADYSSQTNNGQAAWLNENANLFSEWSTICTTKAIGKVSITIPSLDYDSDVVRPEEQGQEKTLYISTLDFVGQYKCADISETLYSYNIKLYDNIGELLENSGIIYTNQYINANQFNYVFQTELRNEVNYSIVFSYNTINKYEKTISLTFQVTQLSINKLNADVITVDNDSNNILSSLTSLYEEEEEGRIVLKVFSTDESVYSGNICIRRADSRDNFKTWKDIKILTLKQQIINVDVAPVYDYTIESGVWYKYGIQNIDKNGDRGILNQMTKPIMRNFNYSFLLGEDNKQLKLQFNNDMNSYKINLSESKTDTIGGQYGFVTRNGNTRYRTIPVNGLISFNMDENQVFTSRSDAFFYDSVAALNNEYNRANGISQYDYIYEKAFREKVLEFLHDGKPKLFKSPTEGNILIRLMDINCAPLQGLSRLVYSFTSSGHEIAAATMDNYLKYNFYKIGSYGTDFSTCETKLGQLQMSFPVGENIFKMIYDKYDTKGASLAGYVKALVSIRNVRIKIDDIPLRIQNSAGDIVMGNNFLYGDTGLITIYGGREYYEFDTEISFTKDDNLILLGDMEGKVKRVNATIDFLYELESKVYESKEVKTRTLSKGIGQVYNSFAPEESIFRTIYYKYYSEWALEYRRLNEITTIEIEANPGAIFAIKDEADKTEELHEVGWTGILNFHNLSSIIDLKYHGMRKADGSIDVKQRVDATVNYNYSVVKGTYKEERV